MQHSHHPDLTVFHVTRPVLLLLAVALLLLLSTTSALAQAPVDAPDGATGGQGSNPILFLPLLSGNNMEAVQGVDTATSGSTTAVKLLIDTDPGVDDAVALAWIFSQRSRPVQVLGVVSVAGNTSVAHTTNNAITVLEKLGQRVPADVPVVMGAAAPLAQPLSKTSYFIHGPDGLWFLGLQNPHDLSSLPRNAPDFYCSTVQANPGTRILALGPLTNIAQALQQCAAVMKQQGVEIVVLGGAKFGGNKTPVAEYNFWQDPEAARIVLESDLPITLVLYDAFKLPQVTSKDVEKLVAKGNATVQFLAPAIQQYLDVQLANTGGAVIPDAVAAFVALNPSEGVRQSALVKLILEQSLARGQSVVGLTNGERISMIASDEELSALAELAFAFPPDPNFNLQWALGAILMREPDNARAVTAVAQNLLDKSVLPDLRAR
jgi:inosine-uridine nucleoside N-ribohydrolase